MMWWLLLTGCLYTVRIESRPSPAVVQMPDGSRVTTPAQVQLRWRPLTKRVATATANGYRPYDIELRRLRNHRALWGQPVDVEVMLIPAHGATGTWTVEDVP